MKSISAARATQVGPPHLDSAEAMGGGVTGSVRVDWLDVAKGVAILAVVFGHVLGAHTGLRTLQTVLWTARVPLFFFLAGVVRRSTGGTIRAAAATETRRIVVPYAIFSAVAIASYVAVAPNQISLAMAGDLVREALRGTAGAYGMAYNPALWFLTCLVCVILLAQVIERLGLLGVRSLLASLLVAGALQQSGLLDGTVLAWNADIAIMALPFFLAGKLLGLRLAEQPMRLPRFKTLALILSVGAAVTAVVVSLNGRVDMNLRLYGNVWLFQLGALAGIVIMLVISIMLRRVSVLVIVGRSSLTILGTHMIFIQQFTPVTKAMAWYGTRLFGHELAGALLVTAVLAAFGVAAHELLRRVFPIAIGQRRAGG